MLQKLWQRIGYYFRVDFHTIQGRLTAGFLTLAVLSAGVILTNHQIWKGLSKDRDYVVEVVDPSMLLTQKILLGVERSYSYLSNTNGLGEQIRLQTWEEILADKDSLAYYSELWEDANFEVAHKYFVEQVTQVKKDQNLVAAGGERLKASHEFHGRVRHAYNTLMDKFMAHKLGQETNSARLIRRMNWILAISFLFALILASGLGSFLITTILTRLRNLRHHIRSIADGQLPPTIPNTRDELNSIIKSVNSLVENLRQITNFAADVGAGDFESDITVFEGQGALGQSLAEMRQSLQTVAEDNKQRRWFNEGIAQFADLMRKHNNDLDELCDHVIRHLVHYLNATQGGIFVANEDESGDTQLEMRGLYAYDRKKFLNWSIKPGQGLAGQAYREQERVLLKEIPQDYTEISSGLGDATPNFIAIMPMISNEEIYGVIEVAAFHELAAHELEFYQTVSENIAAAIATVKISQETNRLLEESQMATEQLRAQEEEMRQNAEELQATQEEIHRQMREASDQRDMFMSLFKNVDGVMSRSKNDEVWTKTYLSENVEDLTGYHPSQFLEKKKSFGEIIHPDDLMPVMEKGQESLKKKQPWTLQFRLVKRDGTVVWVEEKGRGVYNEEGEAIFIDAIIHEITDEVKIQEAKATTV